MPMWEICSEWNISHTAMDTRWTHIVDQDTLHVYEWPCTLLIELLFLSKLLLLLLSQPRFSLVTTFDLRGMIIGAMARQPPDLLVKISENCPHVTTLNLWGACLQVLLGSKPTRVCGKMMTVGWLEVWTGDRQKRLELDFRDIYLSRSTLMISACYYLMR